jgi:hypothetical protein
VTGKRINPFAALTSVATPQFTLTFSRAFSASRADRRRQRDAEHAVVHSDFPDRDQSARIGAHLRLPRNCFFQLTQPLGVAPFHVSASPTGGYSLSVPGVPVGLYGGRTRDRLQRFRGDGADADHQPHVLRVARVAGV